MATFDDLLKQTQLPEPALGPIREAWDDALALIVENNKMVAQVNATRDSNPNNPDFLDSLWRTHAPADEKMKEVEEQYQALIEQSEKLLVQLRDFAKKHVPESLSEDKAKEARKTINEMAPTISTAKSKAENMLIVVNTMLGVHGVEIPEGGIISLLPPIESLKNQRGRKAGTSLPSGGYMTRVDEILIEGKSTNQNDKGKFNFAADALSKMWGAERFPANRVTAEELETAYLAEFGYADRATSKEDKESKLPDTHTFTFEREIEVPNGNDDSTKKVPQKIQIEVKRERKANAPIETPKQETEKQAEPKQETKSETEKQETVSTPAPAKKTATPAPKK
jgi:hypothetical protein